MTVAGTGRTHSPLCNRAVMCRWKGAGIYSFEFRLSGKHRPGGAVSPSASRERQRPEVFKADTLQRTGDSATQSAPATPPVCCRFENRNVIFTRALHYTRAGCAHDAPACRHEPETAFRMIVHRKGDIPGDPRACVFSSVHQLMETGRNIEYRTRNDE